VSFSVKLIFFAWLQIVIRWTLPRFRYDQLMRLGWKGLLPASLVNVVLSACLVLLGENHA
jgi:NADH-quinone oxidoreductase subunit H